MAGASGGPADLVVSLSIFVCVLLLASVSLRRLAESAGWKQKRLRSIELALRHSPLALFVLLLAPYVIDHLTLDMSSAHVARNLAADSTLLDRVIALSAGADGAMLLLLTIAAATHVLLRARPPTAVDSDTLDRWFALLWLSSLTMLLPPELFSTISDSIVTPITRDLMISNSTAGLVAIPLGVVLGAGPHALVAANQGLSRSLSLHALTALLLLVAVDWSVLFPSADLARSGWPVGLLSLPQSERLAAFICIWIVFAAAPVIMARSAQLDRTFAAGSRRWIALAAGMGVSLCALIASAYLSLLPDWSAASVTSALLQELFPLLFFAASFCLLPVMGLDERARPELHGWRLGLLVGLLAAGLVGRPISLPMAGGWLLALLISTWIPLGIESQRMLFGCLRIAVWAIPLVGVLALVMTSLSGQGMQLPLIVLSALALLSSTAKAAIIPVAMQYDGDE